MRARVNGVDVRRLARGVAALWVFAVVITWTVVAATIVPVRRES